MKISEHNYNIGLIVDHPLRDLKGIVLIAKHLLELGYNCYLIPMYNQDESIFLNLDFLLLNYIRDSNMSLVKTCIKINLPIGVLDTEGGVFPNIKNHFSNIAKKVKKYPSIYFFWGKEQYEGFLESTLLEKKRLVITGSPRHDFCHQNYRHILIKKALKFNKKSIVVLVNTNFHRFNSFNKNKSSVKKNLISDRFISESEYYEVQRQSEIALTQLVQYIKKLSSSFPNLIFIVRPHPFEDINFYYKKLYSYKNIYIIRENTSLDYINISSIVIQPLCTTAIEGMLLSKHVINLVWKECPSLYEQIPALCGINCFSYEELNQAIVSFLNENKKSKTNLQVINDYFCKNDGQSAYRVSNEIASYMKNISSTSTTKRLSLFKYYFLLKSRSLKAFLRMLFMICYLEPLLDRLKKHISLTDSSIKSFYKEDIIQVLDKIYNNKTNFFVDEKNILTKKIYFIKK